MPKTKLEREIIAPSRIGDRGVDAHRGRRKLVRVGHVFLAATFATMVASCSDGESDVQSRSTDTGADCAGLFGAWEGIQLGPKDTGEAFCFVFCENGRLFVGDSACSATTRSDFDQFDQWTCQNGMPTVSDTSLSPSLSSGTLTVSVEGSPFFEGQAVAEPGLCDDPTRTERMPDGDGGA